MVSAEVPRQGNVSPYHVVSSENTDACSSALARYVSVGDSEMRSQERAYSGNGTFRRLYVICHSKLKSFRQP